MKNTAHLPKQFKTFKTLFHTSIKIKSIKIWSLYKLFLSKFCYNFHAMYNSVIGILLLLKPY